MGGRVYNIIEQAQVQRIRGYRKRLDVDAQIAELDDLCECQPHLVAVANAKLAPLGEEAQCLGLNALATAWRLFESVADAPVPPVTAAALEKRYDKLLALMANMHVAHDKFVERAIRVRYARQPYVVRYLERQCLAYGQGELEERLPERALGTTFALVGAAVDVMHFSVAGDGYAPVQLGRIGVSELGP
jgi:hypothetical protein